MQKFIIAIDSFKGCLSSSAIADAVAEGLQRVFPNSLIDKIPIADGGEGTVDALVKATNGQFIEQVVNGPLMYPLHATYGISGDNRIAVIEMSAASGLSLIPYKEGNIMHTTTYGTGEMIANAIRRGCREFILGIGGSATNDAGIGMMQALGFHFTDHDGNEVGPGGKEMEKIVHIDSSQALPELKDCRFYIATDVHNPFCGPNGAAYIFGTQKGGTPQQIELLDRGMRHLANLIRETIGIDIKSMRGAGAGGGMGGGCIAFLEARIEPGIEMVKRFLHFDERIQGATLIITGEGKIDDQTLQGKVISGVVKSAYTYHIPVIALTGNKEEAGEKLYEAGLTAIFSIHPAPVSLTQAIQPTYAHTQLRNTAEQIARMLNIFCQ